MVGGGAGPADLGIVRKNVDAAQKLAQKAYSILSKANDVFVVATWWRQAQFCGAPVDRIYTSSD